ncbi:hypothetical protein KDN34_06005 [Shewanella yunxiaonensis]|uniref:Uncharacterized protein n=1 Tax=Shewanella yunxiaonensis TaxID=2829809 RepID=A0ABX7YWA2_9GAMM|nr:hypothetical protein [Shewanella yunxiaonensis]QUN06987.1 hypothetical protein KDN34_06005 [Shewanella yunxiaonensis]
MCGHHGSLQLDVLLIQLKTLSDVWDVYIKENEKNNPEAAEAVKMCQSQLAKLLVHEH